MLVGAANPGQPNGNSPQGPVYPSLPPNQMIGAASGGGGGGMYPSPHHPHHPPPPHTKTPSFDNNKPCLAIEGIPFKIATNFQSGDAFTDSIRRHITDLNRYIEKAEGGGKSYDFQIEKSVMSEYS